MKADKTKSKVMDILNQRTSQMCPWCASGGDCLQCPFGEMGKNCIFLKIKYAYKREMENNQKAKK